MSSAFLIPKVRKYGSIFQGMAAAPLPPLEGGARMTTDADEIVARVLDKLADAVRRALSRPDKHGAPIQHPIRTAAEFGERLAQEIEALRERSSHAAPLPAGPGLELELELYRKGDQITTPGGTVLPWHEYERIHEAEAVVQAACSLDGSTERFAALLGAISALKDRLAKQGGRDDG